MGIRSAIQISLLFAVAIGSAMGGERINHEGRILGPLPVVKESLMFNTPEADAVLSAMQIFPVDNALNEDISKRPLLANSDAMIKQIIADFARQHRHVKINEDMNYTLVPDNQPKIDVKVTGSADESDDIKAGTKDIANYPLPPNQPIEGWPLFPGKTTLNEWQMDPKNIGGDRHAITVQPGTGLVWESWLTKLTKENPPWTVSNVARFNLNSNALRPPQWTSGDAAGLCIFAMTVRFDECERGMVEHAVRLVVKRSRRNKPNTAHIYPATHSAGHTQLPDVPAMGQRLRLKANFEIPENWSKYERAVALGLKKYGGMVADNGSIFSISISPDARFPKGCWNNIDQVPITAFDVVQTTGPNEGPRSPGKPTASAGAAQTVTLAAGATLSGSVSGEKAVASWYLYPGAPAPGTVKFENAASANTSATFSAPGTYTLMLKADDGVHTPAYDAVVITVK